MSSDATWANTVAIGPSRVRYGALAALFGLSFIGVMARSLTAANAFGVVIAVGLLGPLLAFSIHRVLRREPLIVIDHHGFTDGRSGRTIPWAAVDEIYANADQGAFGVDHSLRLVLKHRPDEPVKRRLITTNATNEDEIEVTLDGLAMDRGDVIDAVERIFGRPVLTSSGAELHNLRARRR